MQQQELTNSLTNGLKRFFSGTLLSRVTGLLRDMVTAAAFGCTPPLAAFMTAFRFAYVWRRLFGEGALNIAFIPQFEEIRKNDQRQAFAFFTSLNILLVGALGIFVILAEAGLMLFIQSSLCNEEWHFILLLTAIMLPGLLFNSLYSLNTALLQCQKSFFTASFAPALYNLIWVLTAWSLYSTPVAKAMPYLAGALLMAAFVEWLITYVPVWKAIQAHRAFLWAEIKSKLLGLETKKLMIAWWTAAIGIGANQINSTLDPLFALEASDKGPAYLWFAVRLYLLPLSLFGVALSSVLLPPLSRAIKNHELEHYHYLLKFSLKRCATLMIPCTMALFALGAISTKLIYGHGDFDAEAIRETTFCLWGYGTGLFPSALVLILTQAYYAKGNYKFPMKLSFISVALNLFFNSLFVWGFKLGAMSIALATSLSSLFNALILIIDLMKQDRDFATYKGLGYYSLRVGLCSLTAGICAIMIGYRGFADITWDLFIGSYDIQSLKMPWSHHTANFAAQAITFGIIGLILYYFFLRHKEES
ncbi:MAG: hypothetical protein K0S74_339 [Chlamydiales bacterium]|jgi:putative peptidoglycan lipid II flippase|nr:hypothetical protein [Chlamydiales bacterium]